MCNSNANLQVEFRCIAAIKNLLYAKYNDNSTIINTTTQNTETYIYTRLTFSSHAVINDVQTKTTINDNGNTHRTVIISSSSCDNSNRHRRYVQITHIHT